MKLNSSNIIGHYLEISNNHAVDNDEFIHKQSLPNVARYTTNRLVKIEEIYLLLET